MLGCFSRARRPSSSPLPMPPSDDDSTSAASPSAGSSMATSPLSSASCSALLDDPDALYPEEDGAGGLSDSGLSSAIASRRFFLASPGRSNSIVDSSPHAGAGAGVAEAGVAVPTYSPDPHGDFLRSMEEMVAALGLDPRRDGDRVRLHELLLCYLALNDREAHKYVVSAFTDLLLRLAADGL